MQCWQSMKGVWTMQRATPGNVGAHHKMRIHKCSLMLTGLIIGGPGLANHPMHLLYLSRVCHCQIPVQPGSCLCTAHISSHWTRMMWDQVYILRCSDEYVGYHSVLHQCSPGPQQSHPRYWHPVGPKWSGASSASQ